MAKLSLRKMINEHCKECIYDKHEPGNWRQQVEACSVTKCKLWPARPVSSVGTAPVVPTVAP